MDGDVRRYLDDLIAAAHSVLGDNLVGVYAAGSIGLDAFQPGRSDVDVALTVSNAVAGERKRALVAALRHENLPCPARGLELVVYREAVARSGSAVPQLVAALDFWQSVPKEIVIAGDPAASDTKALLRLVHDRFIPNKVLALADGGPTQDELARVVPVVAEKTRRNGRATIYICKNYACRLPTSDPQVAAALLDRR